MPYEDQKIIGKVLITGGSSGLGLELARAYSKNYKVTVLDVQDAPSSFDYVYCDLSSFNPECVDSFDSFDVVICNAGISAGGAFLQTPAEKERAVFEINTFSHIQLIKELLRQDKINPGGRIGFVCSASVYLPFPLALAYASSKAALDGFAHALEPFVHDNKISVSRVYPGPMKTPHVKHYPGLEEIKGADPAKIASKIVKGIQKRKRKIFPDVASRVFWLGSKICPGLLTTFTSKKWRSLIK